MEGMMIIAGIWVAILPIMKWTSMGGKLSLPHYIIGIYVCVMGILSKIENIMPNEIFLKIAFIAVVILEMLSIIKKLRRKERTIVDLLAVLTGIIILVFAISVFVIDTKEIWSSIVMAAGSLIILSISYMKKNKDNDIQVLER